MAKSASKKASLGVTPQGGFFCLWQDLLDFYQVVGSQPFMILVTV